MHWLMATLALAGPPSGEAGPERIVVVGAPIAGSPPGWVAGLGDCLEERRPGAFQVLDRRDASTTWAGLSDMVAGLAEHHPSRVVVALPADDSPELDAAVVTQALDALAEVSRQAWLIVALPIRPDRRGPAYQELSALVDTREAVRILDPWKNPPISQASVGTPPWLAEDRVTPAGESRVASLTCNAVLPRTP